MRIPLLLKFVLVLLLIVLVGFLPFAIYLHFWKSNPLSAANPTAWAAAVAQLQIVHRLGWGIALFCSAAALLWVAHRATRPIARLQQVLERMAEGDYEPLPNDATTRDELGDLHRSLNRLARHLYDEAQHYSARHAACSELVTMLPFPLALLDARLGPDVLNAEFRQATGIDKATEDAKMHKLLQYPAFLKALDSAQQQRQRVSFTVALPWLQRTVSFLLCPIPASQGTLQWALIVPATPLGLARHAKEIDKLLQQGVRLLSTLTQRNPEEYLSNPEQISVFVHQVRVLSDLVHAFQSDPDAWNTISLDMLVDFVRTEAQPLLKENQVAFETIPTPSPIALADANKRVEHVLRAAVMRVVQAVRSHHPTPAPLTIPWVFEITETHVRCGFPKLPQPIETDDLDQLLAPLGGAVYAYRDASGTAEAPSERRPELWLHLRRA